MYYAPYTYPYQSPYYANAHMYDYTRQPNFGNMLDGAYQWGDFSASERSYRSTTDFGQRPFVVNINQAAKQNNTFRTAIWTGKHLQVTLMSIGVGEDIGLEIHPNTDQFLRVEQGQGIVQMGKRRDHLDFMRRISDDSAIFVPAGTWHNVTNTGNVPLKLYSIYAPPQHPFGTVHRTKAEAMAAE